MSLGSTWTGYIRKSSRAPWVKVCEDPEFRGCHLQLLKIAEKRGVATKNTILAGPGRRPPEAEK